MGWGIVVRKLVLVSWLKEQLSKVKLTHLLKSKLVRLFVKQVSSVKLPQSLKIKLVNWRLLVQSSLVKLTISVKLSKPTKSSL